MIGLGLLLAGILLTLRAAIRTRSLALSVLAVSLFAFYGIRGIGIALHVDTPYPDYLFSATNLDSAMGRFGLLVLVFCLSVIVAHHFSRDAATLVAKFLPLPSTRLKPGLVLGATLATTALATALALYQVTSHGGFGQAVYSAKSTREAGEALMRIPATIAIVLSCSLFYSAKRTADGLVARRTLRAVALTCALASAVSASVWGSRQFAVLAAAYLLGAPAIAGFRNARRSWFVSAALVFTIVVGIGFGLRLYRDDILGGETAVSQAQGNEFRQISISVNGTSLDSSLLAVKDWPRVHSWRNGVDFTDGIWGAVPQSMRPDGVLVDTIGAQFHRIYEPDTHNGWPIGAPTEWYINFGWAGVIIGGLLTGWIYRALTNGLQRSPMPELATVATLVMTLIVFPMGVSAASANRFVIHAIPLLAMLTLLRVLSGPQNPSGAPPRSVRQRARGGRTPVPR